MVEQPKENDEVDIKLAESFARFKEQRKKNYKKHVEYMVKKYKDDPKFRELCKQRAKANYQKKKASPEFREHTRKKALEYYHKMKAEKAKKKEFNIEDDLKIELDIE